MVKQQKSNVHKNLVSILRYPVKNVQSRLQGLSFISGGVEKYK